MFKLQDYILTPKDIFHLGKKLCFELRYTDWLGILIMTIYFFIFSWFLHLSAEPLFFIGFILTMIYWRLDSRVSIVLAIICLVSLQITLFISSKNILLQGEDWAEQVAVWAYCFLVIGVIKQIFEYWTDSRKHPEKFNDNDVWKNICLTFCISF